MSLKALNNILKLKLMKIKYLLIITTKNSNHCLDNVTMYYLIYLNFLYKTQLNSFGSNLLNYNYPLSLKFNYFKVFNNLNLDFLFIYNLLSANKVNLNKLLSSNKITNYDYKYLFIYYFYFVQNIKFGLSKYFTNFYQNNFFFFKFFVLKYLNNFVCDRNLYLKFNKNNLDILSDKSYYYMLLKKVRYLKFLNDVNLKSKAFLNLLLVVLYTKDAMLLKNAIKSILENLHFKTHRKFLYNLKIILKSLSYIFYSKFKCLGLSIRVKGKIGVGGNSKKRKFLYKFGSFSFTKKNQKLSYAKDSIRTYSGVLGFEVYLTYL